MPGMKYVYRIQIEQSSAWWAYDKTVKDYIKAYLPDFEHYEHAAIWLQTEEGWEQEYEGEALMFTDDELADYIASEYIYREAGCWTNSKLRVYINGCD